MGRIVFPAIVIALAIGFAATVLALTPVQSDDDFERFPKPDPGGPPDQVAPDEQRPPASGDPSLGLPAPRPPLAVVQLAMSDEEVCALTSDGWLTCWALYSSEPVEFPEGPFVQVTAGSDHFCALDAWGNAECWGSDDDAQLVVPNAQLQQLAAGNNHTCGLDILGEPACWGDLDPELEPPTGPFQTIAAGGDRTCAGSAAEAPRCWGTPELIESFRDPLFGLAASSTITCGINVIRTPQCVFAENSSPFSPPRELSTAVAPGEQFICVLDTLGEIRCTGPAAPTLPEETIIARTISSNDNVLCAVTVLNDVLCWNQNQELFRS